MLIVSHGLPSIPLYAAQAALALGARRVDFASDDEESLALAERLGAHPLRDRLRQAPADAIRSWSTPAFAPAGLDYALRATEPEGICQSVSFYPGRAMPLPLGRMYTLGIRFFVGRCHAAALLPEVVPLIERGRLRPGESRRASSTGRTPPRPSRSRRSSSSSAQLKRSRDGRAEHDGRVERDGRSGGAWQAPTIVVAEGATAADVGVIEEGLVVHGEALSEPRRFTRLAVLARDAGRGVSSAA